MDYLKLKSQAEEAAIQAGAAIMSVYNSDNFGEQIKSDRSPLTVADKAAHDIIANQLEKTGIPILSEEGKMVPYSARKNWERFWMIDPLDGTKEFIQKNGQFTVNIALIEGSQSKMGVIYAPATEVLYSGLIEKGAVRKKGNEVSPLKNKSTSEDLSVLKKQKGLNVLISRSHLDENTSRFIESLPDAHLVSMGSSLKFMAIAEGDAEIYPRFAPTMEWDTAAAQAILASLGYGVYTWPEMKDMSYNKEDLQNPYFIAY